MPASGSCPNPYETTALEIAATRSQQVFRSRHRLSPRQRLEASDELVGRVERCRLQELARVDAPAWSEVVALAGAVDPRLRAALGSDRRPDHVGEILFAVQARLMQAALAERQRGLAPVIPLFPSA